jgi:hypothetical protein
VFGQGEGGSVEFGDSSDMSFWELESVEETVRGMMM